MDDFIVTKQTLAEDTTVLKLKGTLQDRSYDRLAAEIKTVTDDGVTSVVLDLSGLAAMTSAGLGLMINFNKDLAAKGGKLILASPTRDFIEILELLGIKNTFTFSSATSGIGISKEAHKAQ